MPLRPLHPVLEVKPAAGSGANPSQSNQTSAPDNDVRRWAPRTSLFPLASVLAMNLLHLRQHLPGGNALLNLRVLLQVRRGKCLASFRIYGPKAVALLDPQAPDAIVFF